MFKTNKKAFTMAEALSVLILLGVVAAVTIPATVNRVTANQNRARIKKAIATYDSAVRLMISENRITSTARLNNLMSANDCSRVYSYFKAVESHGCIFKTTDGVWWNMAVVSEPIVAFNRANVTEDAGRDLATNNAFCFNAEIDSNDRQALRVNDLTYLENNGDYLKYAYLQKTYNFLENKKNKSSKINVIKYNSGDLTDINIAKGETKVVVVDGADRQYSYKITNTSDTDNPIKITKENGKTYIKASNVTIEEDNKKDDVYIEGSGIDYKGGDGNKKIVVNVQGTGAVNIDLGTGNNDITVDTFTPMFQ